MKRWLLTVAVAAGAAAPMGRADSIWERRDPRYAYLFQDNRARAIGDVITVAITQTTVANDTDTRTLSKNTNATAGAQFGTYSLGYSPGTATSTGGGVSPLFTVTSNRNFNGNAAVTSNQVFTDTMGALVVDILPNGNLVIEGYRTMVVAGEERVLRMTGIVRPADIAYPNIISSNSVANFRISYLGRGPQTRFSSQNFLSRAFNRLWPF
jgi:flagellar L-ring protein precursor FlgH